MNKKEYCTCLKKTTYEYLNSVRIAKMIASGLTYKEIFKKCYNEMLIPTPSNERRREITNVIYERLSTLDSILLYQFINSSVETSKYILVYAIAKTDKIFYEFLFQCYREAILGSKQYISSIDFEVFFETEKEKSPIVRKWSQKSIEDLGTGFKNVLINSGLAKKEVKNLIPLKAVIPMDIVNHINDIGDGAFIKATLGV